MNVSQPNQNWISKSFASVGFLSTCVFLIWVLTDWLPESFDIAIVASFFFVIGSLLYRKGRESATEEFRESTPALVIQIFSIRWELKQLVELALKSRGYLRLKLLAFSASSLLLCVFVVFFTAFAMTEFVADSLLEPLRMSKPAQKLSARARSGLDALREPSGDRVSSLRDLRDKARQKIAKRLSALDGAVGDSKEPTPRGPITLSIAIACWFAMAPLFTVPSRSLRRWIAGHTSEITCGPTESHVGTWTQAILNSHETLSK